MVYDKKLELSLLFCVFNPGSSLEFSGALFIFTFLIFLLHISLPHHDSPRSKDAFSNIMYCFMKVLGVEHVWRDHKYLYISVEEN